MKATTLTISIPSRGCDKNCPYCISKMTGPVEENDYMFEVNTDKVKTLAVAAGVSTVLITGKGEPCMNYESLVGVMQRFYKWPIELQTNGLKLLDDVVNCRGVMLNKLNNFGLNVLALSIDKIEDINKYAPLFEMVNNAGLVNRITVNITKMIPDDTRLDDFVTACIINNIQQLSFRKVVKPNFVDNDVVRNKEVEDWIHQNHADEMYDRFIRELMESDKYKHHLIRTLPYGVPIYSYRGTSVTFFDYCIQDNNNTEDIRSLIYQEDGHLYTSWNSKASILF